MSTQLSYLLSMQSIITNVDNSDGFRSVSDINSKRQDSINPEEISSHLCIGLKTAARTLKATFHKYIITTGFLTKKLCTDKAHIFYKHLYRQYCNFYTDFLKLQVTSISVYCG